MPNANPIQKLPSLASLVDRQPLIVTSTLPLVKVITLMSQAKGQICLLPNSDPIASDRVLEIAAAARHSAVLVIENRRLIGIFTERDLVKLSASQTDLHSVQVGEVMTVDPITLVLSEQHTVMTALGIFQQHKIRHLPILDDLQQLIGVVTPEHIRQILQPVNLLRFRSIAEGMTTAVIQATPTTTILEIAQMMVERGIGSIVIMDGDEPLRPVGIITERDVVQFQAFELDLDQLLAAAVMSTPLFCLQPTDSLWAAQQVMQTKNIRRLVIKNDRGELVGILTQSNLLQLLDPLEMLCIVDSLQSQLLDRAAELEQTNRELRSEVARREQVEAALRRASQTLEERVLARTAESALLTEELQIKVSEQRSCNVALEASQQGISDFIENALIGMNWVDIEGNIVWVNQAELNMFGYDRSQYIGQPLINFHIDRIKLTDLLQRVSRNESMRGCEAQVWRKDGSICDVSIDAHAFFKDGKFIHTRCFTRDITDQKRAETVAHTTLTSLQFQKYALDRSAIVAATDRQGQIIYVNDKFCEISQYSETELLGKTHQIINSGYHPSEFFRDLWAVISSRQVWSGEIKNRAKDGSFYWVAMTIVPCLDERGQPFQYLSIQFDITSRKQAEESLRDSERKFRAIFDNTFEFMGLLDPDGIVLEVNRTALDAVGATLDDVSGQPFWTTPWWTHYPDVQVQLQQAIVQAATGQLIRFEAPSILADGSHIIVDFSLSPIFDDTGKVVMLIPEGRDITERKAAAQKIQEQAALLDIATDAIIVRDLNGQIQFWNNGATAIYGWLATEAIDRTTAQLFYPDTPPETAVAIAFSSVLDRGSWQGELHKVTKTGKEVIVESRWTLMRDEAGNPRSILSVDTDITEKKSLEQQFLRAQRLESLGSLASGIAHDLNNVLTPIVGAAQLLPLTLSNLDDRSRRLLNMLVESSKRGSGLVKQILTFARGLDGERAVLQVRHILTEIISVARQTFPRSIEIEVNNDIEDLWLVSIDATQIHQVLMNLFVNARDAMPNGGTIAASAENIVIDADYAQLQLQPPLGSYILITIADTGMGMTREMLDRIFDPFFTTKETGTGLGLSTVQGIVKAHGGAIEVESEVGRGTCFKIYLPANDRREVESPTTAEDLYDGQGRLVLVVDDETAIREITKESLETYNYRVILASDGIEAIDIYTQNHHRIAIVLIDMMMPHLDTPSIILALQQINPEVQIVVMSGSYLNLAAIVDKQQVSAVLTKPFTTAEMLQTLAEI
ncbi:PAS domain S-box protein [Chamaesiphon sp. OTE_8_metabat_110]|uniref:PAS domain S-box protein n=1 Tax=Chamaesiphon sp. OTE_8_metabat_110 TaxID=2964696 RepID=UPI00286B06DD|nr:PAS domain S-box protein [Chamaesiphon sp. OTE_8_metabat_110]